MEYAYDVFKDRREDIEEYFDFLTKMERSINEGAKHITASQYHVLLASGYVMVYNMVEATVIKAIEEIEREIASHSDCPFHLAAKLKDEWLTIFFSIDAPTIGERLGKARKVYELLREQQPLAVSIYKKSNMNWDDERIGKLAKKFGLDMQSIPPKVVADAKKIIKDNKGSLKHVLALRNKLAHGEISFNDCGKETNLEDIKTLYCVIVMYLEGVLEMFETFLVQKEYIDPIYRAEQCV